MMAAKINADREQNYVTVALCIFYLKNAFIF